jgi:transcriptional regulator with XRE-family HTH domain
MTARQERELGAFGRAVRQLRNQQCMSAGELATAAGLDRSCIERIEAGRLDPGYHALRALADGFCVPASVLLSRAEELEGR